MSAHVPPAATLPPTLRRLDRAAIQPHVGLLSSWLLPGAIYGVHHTWPQLYRSDGGGSFLAAFAGDRLVGHCAFRSATARTAAGPLSVALVGSVATDPAFRGRGLATRLLREAMADCRRAGLSAAVLWAGRPELYARLGFRHGAAERALLLRAPPADASPGAVRPCTIADHPHLHALHLEKPLGIERGAAAMSGLLTTPGMWTCVLERNGRIVAYACTGKGADLQGWWHELGGSDDDVAALLPAAMRAVGQARAFVLCPPYRPRLATLLAPLVQDEVRLDGPMVLGLSGGEPPPLWIDGLDSV